MTSQNDVFTIAGPMHLTSVDWNCPHHRRCVAASLVQGAYVLQRDRQNNRRGPDARAPPWWQNFHFELVRVLVDDADFSIFGAIYEFKPPFSILGHTAPKFVIAFRGTITNGESVSRDLILDLHIIKSGLDGTSRFRIGMQAVRSLASAVGGQNIWLAGHSLGSAMATLAGKNMAKIGVNIKAYLFNPPFLSAPIESIKDKKVKHGIRVANSFITAGVAAALKGHHHLNSGYDAFAMLSSWVPHIFANPADHISSEYIGYFEHRRKMEEIGAGKTGRSATKNSVKDLLLSAFGRESEPLHLMPSATLTVNLSPSPDFKRAHGIHQWWKPDLNLQTKDYRYS